MAVIWTGMDGQSPSVHCPSSELKKIRNGTGTDPYRRAHLDREVRLRCAPLVQPYKCIHVMGTVNCPLSINLGQQTSNKNGWAQRWLLYRRQHCMGMFLHILPLYTHLSPHCSPPPLLPHLAHARTCMHMPPSATARCSPLILTFQALLQALHHNPYPTTAPLSLTTAVVTLFGACGGIIPSASHSQR